MKNNTDEQFELKGKNAQAVGEPVEGGFVVREGSTARKEVVPSAVDFMTPVRSQLLADGVVIEEDGKLRFTKDHVFDSPSGAAAAVLGRSSNGWVAWKLADGRTLSEVKRVARPTGEMMLTDAKHQEITEKHQELLNEGRIYTEAQLQKCYSAFKTRFGPDALRGLDGEQLLDFIHDHGNRDSLVYWLEFKNDDEFDTKRFGSIAGGSALKFRIFRRKETGHWQAGDET